jgi:hypothetical protein
MVYYSSKLSVVNGRVISFDVLFSLLKNLNRQHRTLRSSFHFFLLSTNDERSNFQKCILFIKIRTRRKHSVILFIRNILVSRSAGRTQEGKIRSEAEIL